MGYVHVITIWGDVGRAWWWGFLDRIAQPNQRLESGMSGASQVVKWSQCVSRLKTISDRNSIYTPKYLFDMN